MSQYHFNVFGKTLSIERVEERWLCHWVGTEGKRRPAQLAVPNDLTREELAQYLYDIYHESATPTNGDVVEITHGPQGTAPGAQRPG